MMGFSKFRAKDMVVIIIAAAACASVVSGSITDKKDEIPLERSDQSEDRLRDLISSSIDNGSKSLSSSSDIKATNDTSITRIRDEKKVIHRLIGGHVKLLHHKDERMIDKDEDLGALSAGNGKEKNQREDDDEKKSLSQQVKEGKYGLIQNEIYPTTPKRPGVISYLGNPEVPRDTSRNYGGLDEDEIWLAENHLLVLRGGKFPGHGNRGPITETNASPWGPIDDYEAPKRQVKIPSRPEVPPPFPVQLAEGGPVQIIRANGSVSIVNETTDYDEYANYPDGFFPGEAPFYPAPSNDSSELKGPGNGSYLPPSSVTSDPFYASLPPGAVFLPPPNNRSEDYDEDDQSIYYPPPYSFYYNKEGENATLVPPGPLVPGIILPPPPDFFEGLYEENSTTEIPATTTEEESTTAKTTTYTPPRRKTIAKPSYKQRITTTPNSPTVTTTRPTTKTRPLSRKTLAKTKTRNFSTQNYDIETTTMMTTTKIPEKSTTNYYETELENQLVDLGPPQEGEWTGIVSTTSVPLLAYFATTPSSSERNRKTEDLAPVHVEADISGKNQASYYFYEETNAGGVSTTKKTPTTTTPSPRVYFETSTPSSYYNIEPLGSQRQSKKHHYYSVEMIPSQQTANDYETKLKTFTKTVRPPFNDFSSEEIPRNRAKYNVERIRGQSEQTLADNSQRYYQPASAKPYYTTQRPRFYYRTPEDERYDYRDERELKSNPIYQYNYEASDYAKQQRNQGYRNQQEEVYGDYQQPLNSGNRYYDYETRPIVKTEKKIPHQVPYSQPEIQSYSTVTERTINTTPNPEQVYYTRQEEQLLDDVTKEYFTIFGKKLPEVVGGIQSTTPLYRIAGTTTDNPVNTYVPNRYNDGPVHQIPRYKPPRVKVHYGDQTQRPYSLEGDTLVNYKNPLPTINPDAEYINVNEPAGGPEEFETESIAPFRNEAVGVENYPPVSNNQRESYRGRYSAQPPISLANDIAVNYRNPRPPINPDAESIGPIQEQGNLGNRGGSYFAYKLPGNGGHFYFLTPQAISQRQDIEREYFYSKPIDPRLIRRRRRGPAEG